ncbi:MAG TPA: ABC transporter substrate-binding protein [bacterium]|nr:ABC transporter substrate-binding protein [bacterium]
MRTATRIGVLVAVLVLAATVSVGVSQERGVTDTEIVIGSSQPLSGPAAFWGQGVGGGMDAYLKWINDAGGINGRKIRLVLRDDGYLPTRAVANVRELVERERVFAIVSLIGSANAFAARDYIIENQVLWITPTADANMWAGFKNKKYLFVGYPGYVDEGRILTTYAAKNEGVKSVAVFYQNDLYGQKGLLGIKRGIADTKIKLAAAVSYEGPDRDFSAHAVKLRQSGADAVILYATPTQGALIVREMAKIGFSPKLFASFTLADPVMFQLAGDAWNGIILTAYFPVPGTDPKVDAMLDTLLKINPQLRQSPFNALAGVSFLEPFVEAIRRAGPNVTRDSVVRALESMRNWNGEVIRGITFSPQRHQGLNRIYIIKSENRQYKKLTDWIEYPVGY